MKQTAVEWLQQQLETDAIMDYSFAQAHKIITLDIYAFNKLIEQAKEIEKQQIISAFNEGMINSADYFGNAYYDESEQYYNETFKK